MKLNTRFLALLVSFIALFGLGTLSRAEACDAAVLPAQINKILNRDFAGWSLVTPELLTSPDDRQIWQEDYGNECPGIISGHFTSSKIAYAVSMVKGRGDSLEQQIVLFEPNGKGFKKLVIDPASHVDVVTVLRKFSPGEYRSPDSGKSVTVKFDTIGVSEIEAGTIVFYWDGKQFKQIETST